MRIRLNGEPHELERGVSIRALVAALGLQPERVAIEHNRRILKRSEFDDVTVNDGDDVEIVTFVGGG